jgi:hypothetical protein
VYDGVTLVNCTGTDGTAERMVSLPAAGRSVHRDNETLAAVLSQVQVVLHPGGTMEEGRLDRVILRVS